MKLQGLEMQFFLCHYRSFFLLKYLFVYPVQSYIL